MASPVRVRFAPSPTGYLHIGGLRSALYNWLFARRHGGTFILRVEDTDRSRYVEGAIENLYRSLAACGLTPDEGVAVEGANIVDKGMYGPYLQSARREKHLAYAYELIEKDAAYYCFCTAERLDEVRKQQQLLKQPIMYDRHCRSLSKVEAENRAAVGDEHVIRLKVPTEGSIKMHDLIRGDVEIPWLKWMIRSLLNRMDSRPIIWRQLVMIMIWKSLTSFVARSGFPVCQSICLFLRPWAGRLRNIRICLCF